MNLNDFVVLPNNKAKSVKLNARNLQELQMKTVTLAKESEEMEEKLQQLKESMSKEKEERGHSGGRWKSGQCGSINSSALTNNTKKNKENKLQKLSAGKVKIRLLKDELLTHPPQPPPVPPTVSHRTARKNRLRGTVCGQCEVKAAGLMCAECTEAYCISCFTRFHQKGALKLHRMIPIQTDIQTHVNTRDVVNYFQKQTNPSSYQSASTSQKPGPGSESNHNHAFSSNAITRGDQNAETGTEAMGKHMASHHDPSQGLIATRREDKKVEMREDGQKREDKKGFSTSLLEGEFDEDGSARSFQEALSQWRRERSDGEKGAVTQEKMWEPVRPVSVSAAATQADLPPDRGRGRGERQGIAPFRVEFVENNLTYMDRLFLKKHRRTPIETHQPSLAFGTDIKSLLNTDTEEETASSLTAQEEDFRRYYTSLFAVPGRTQSPITTAESCLIIELLDDTDRDRNGVCDAEQRKDNIKVPSVQQVSSKGSATVSQTLLTSSGFSRVSQSNLSRTQPSRKSKAPIETQAPQKIHLSKPQTSPAEQSMKVPFSKRKPPAYLAAETPRASQTSIKTSASKSQKPSCSPTVNNSKPGHRSQQIVSSPSLPHFQTQEPKSSNSSLSFASDASPSASVSPPRPLSLRSTFSVSPSSSTMSVLLPEVYESTPIPTASPSPLLPEQSQSSQLFPETTSSLTLFQSSPSNLESPMQSQHDPESLLSDNHLRSPLSPESSTPNPPPKSPVPHSTPENKRSSFSLLNQSPLDIFSRYGSIPTHDDSPSFMPSTPMTCDSESSLSPQDSQCIPSVQSHLSNAIQNPPLAGKMEKEEELSMDSEDEMSSDSLGLVPHEEDSSDEEPTLRGCLASWRSREIEQGNSAVSHLEDPFVLGDAGRESDLWTDEPEQLSEPSVVMHNRSAGSGSEQSCDLDEFSPAGLDMNCGHSDTPEHTHCDTHRISPHDSDQTGSAGVRPSSGGLSTYTEDHLVFPMTKDNQQTGIQIHSTTPTRRGEISANERGTSELGPVFRPLSQAAQEIMEICGVDQAGCEDPDLDIETTAHTLHELERDLKLMAKETGAQTLVVAMGNRASEAQHGNQRFTRGRVGEEQTEEDEAAEHDRQSVILLC